MKEENYFWMYRRDVLQNVRTYTFIIVVPHYSPINLLNHYGLKVHRFGAGDLKSPRGLFFNNKIRVRTIFWSSMVLQVLIDHLVCDISGAPATKSYCPKVSTPVSLF